MRAFYSDGSSVQEFTAKIKNYRTDSFNFTYLTSHAIYISSDFPFNHFYLKVGELFNTNSSDMVIEIWDGNNWIESVAVNDYTTALNSSGFIDFTPNRDKRWALDDTNYGGRQVTGLETISVYDQYWIKITFTNDLEAVDIDWLGHKFSDDSDLYSEYPIFDDSNFLTAFQSLKTDWEEQHVKAAELIIQDLKRKRVILGEGQILERSVFTPAATSKTAEILFSAFGKDYFEHMGMARKEYDKRMDLSQFVVDSNNDGIKDAIEVRNTQGWLSR